MRFKFWVLILLLVISEVAPAYYVYHPCCSRLRLPGWWANADYMFVWRKKRFYPALVTTNPTVLPVLSNPATRILFGDEALGTPPKAGFRADGGIWMTPYLGFGTGCFAIRDEKIKFQINGNAGGEPIFGRPFFNTATGLQDAQGISQPLLFQNGSIEIDTANGLWGYDLYAKLQFIEIQCLRIDLLGGFYYNRLIDNLNIFTRTSPTGIPLVSVSDQFNCKNDYYAGLVGFCTQLRGDKWGLTVSGKIGIGSMVKKVRVIGSTTTNPLAGGVVITQTGLLAQPSNIGEHKRSQYEIVPQVNANLQMRIWGHLWLSAGYSYIYWPAILLAGEQINLRINPTQLPGPIVGQPAPIFHQKNKSFWIQGVTAGFYIFY